MIKAEFGIVEDVTTLPESIPYEPERYGCVAIDDDVYINDWWDRLRFIKTYFENLDRPERSLSRWGTTLIPPESLPALEEIVLSDRRLQTDAHLVALSRVIREAMERKKYVIHFGV